MHLHPVVIQQLADDRHQDLLVSARTKEQLRSTRRGPRARRFLRDRRA